MVNASMEAGGDRLLKAINKAHITKYRGGSNDSKFPDQLLPLADNLAQGGKLPPGCGLAVRVCKHLIELFYKPSPHNLLCIKEDGVDLLCGPGACRSSFHIGQDE